MLKLMPTQSHTDPDKSPVERAAEAVTAAIGKIVKPPRLVAAERLLTRARERRVAAAEAERRAILAHMNHNPGATRLPDDVQALSDELKAADDVIRRCRGDLAAARADFAPAVHGLDEIAELHRQMLTLVDQLATGAAALRTARNYVVCNGLEATRLIDRADHIAGLTAELRRALRIKA